MGIKTYRDDNYWYWNVANVPVNKLEAILNSLGDRAEYVHNSKGELTKIKVRYMLQKVKHS